MSADPRVILSPEEGEGPRGDGTGSFAALRMTPYDVHAVRADFSAMKKRLTERRGGSR
jgi:hypothetical protein